MFWYPLVTVLIWSVNAIVCKLAAGLIEPGVITFYRWLIAWALLTPFVLPGLWGQGTRIRKALPQFIVLALLGMALNQSLGYYAAATISAVNLGIHNALIPMLTVLLSIFMLKEKPTMGIAVGSLLSFTGLLWLISGGHIPTLLHQGMQFGDFLMFLAVLAYALYGVLLKKWPLNFTPWQFMYLQMSCALVLLLPDFVLSKQHMLDLNGWMLVLYAAIPSSLFASLFWMRAVSLMGANRTAIFMNLLPIFTSIIAVTWLDEHLQSFHLIGGSMTLCGVLLCQFWRQPLPGLPGLGGWRRRLVRPL